jgi:predicted dehydrogenase
VTVAAVADPDERSRLRAASAAGAAPYKSAEVLLSSSDVDAVIVAVPTNMHASIGSMAARAGKSFYLEKPIATGFDDARLLRDAFDGASVRAVVGFNRRYHPLYERARSMVAEGRLGKVRAVQTTFCEPVPPGGLPRWKELRETGGGVLLDLGSHHIDLIRWILSAEVVEVNASARSDISEQDSATMNMVLNDGCQVQSFVSFRAGYSDRIELIGEHGTISVDRHRGSLTLQSPRRLGYGTRRRFVAPSFNDAGWRARRLIRPAEDPSYYRALKAFTSATTSSLASLDDGERSLEVVLAAEESAMRGTPVSITRI